MVDWVTTSDRREISDNNKQIVLLPSRVVTTSGSLITSFPFLTQATGMTLFLDVTAAATAAGDTLNLYLQRNVARSSATAVWHDMVSFTQILGNGGAKQFVANVTPADITTGLGPVQDGALAAGTVSGGPLTNQIRVKWVIASASAPSFTLSLTARMTGSR